MTRLWVAAGALAVALALSQCRSSGEVLFIPTPTPMPLTRTPDVLPTVPPPTDPPPEPNGARFEAALTGAEEMIVGPKGASITCSLPAQILSGGRTFDTPGYWQIDSSSDPGASDISFTFPLKTTPGTYNVRGPDEILRDGDGFKAWVNVAGDTGLVRYNRKVSGTLTIDHLPTGADDFAGGSFSLTALRTDNSGLDAVGTFRLPGSELVAPCH